MADNADVTKELLATTDAQFWARKWCEIALDLRDAGQEIIDEGWMIGWFANAMCVAADAERRKIAETIVGYPIKIDVDRLGET
jgi:hypothetical protein